VLALNCSCNFSPNKIITTFICPLWYQNQINKNFKANTINQSLNVISQPKLLSMEFEPVSALPRDHVWIEVAEKSRTALNMLL